MSMIRDYNYIEKVLAFPCATPDPILWFVTFLPAAAPALIDFISYGCRDLVKFKAGIGQPCGRLFKANAVKMYGPQFVDTLHNAIKFTRPLESALFWWFVADLIADTAARWTSLAYQLNGCRELEEETHWQNAFAGPGLLPAGVPVPVSSLIIGEQGKPGIAWPTGAVVPPGWYVQGSFELQARSFGTPQQISPMCWIREEGPHPYDFPAKQYPPGKPGGTTRMSYQLQTQVPDRPRPTQLTMMAMSDVRAISTDMSGTWTASETPVLSWAMSPLGCLRDLTINDVEDPVGQNTTRKLGSSLVNLLPPSLQAVRRGPPGGLPRKKPINS